MNKLEVFKTRFICCGSTLIRFYIWFSRPTFFIVRTKAHKSQRRVTFQFH